MKKNSSVEKGQSPVIPFDDYEEPGGGAGAAGRKTHLGKMRSLLRILSGISFGLAITSAAAVLLLDNLHFFEPGLLSWKLKSAFPLIFIGISYGCIQFTLPRSTKEFLLGMAVSIAFILWGVEQFQPNPAVTLLMDDVVMFLFVLDLGVGIWGHLRK